MPASAGNSNNELSSSAATTANAEVRRGAKKKTDITEFIHGNQQSNLSHAIFNRTMHTHTCVHAHAVRTIRLHRITPINSNIYA